MNAFLEIKFKMLFSSSNVTTVPSIQLWYLATTARLGFGSAINFEELCLRILDQTLAKASRPQQGTSWLGIKSICYLFYRK